MEVGETEIQTEKQKTNKSKNEEKQNQVNKKPPRKKLDIWINIYCFPGNL